MAKDLKRSLTIAGHRTSLSLEPEFWQALQEIAHTEKKTLASIVGISPAPFASGCSSGPRRPDQ
jgi:predicted DNA-binding ribbon-helix-helix protein